MHENLPALGEPSVLGEIGAEHPSEDGHVLVL